MVGLLGDLAPSEEVAHQVEELLHRLKLLLALPLLHSFMNQFLEGMTSGKPGTPGRPGRRGVKGTPGNPGYFKMFFKNLRTGITENITMPRGSITR